MNLILFNEFATQNLNSLEFARRKLLSANFNATCATSSGCMVELDQEAMVPVYNGSEHRFLRLDNNGILCSYKVSP